MSIFRKRNSVVQCNDANLVMSSLGGDRDAFCEIVTRYQNLLCSLAYSSVGDIKYSEDIAQEAFVEAWKKLDTLKEPEKLKAWLCGILRFKVSRYRRKEGTQLTKDASELESSVEDDSDKEQMDDVAIREQEQALLWQTLDKMEDSYREPLILFYREQQSVERVAAELDLTVDTTKQRLSRGRKLLKRAMISFVEDTLTKSKPGLGFTAGVLATISSIAPPAAKAAIIGVGTAKSSSFIKLATFLTLITSLSGLVSAFFGLRANLDQSRTQRERNHVINVTAIFISTAMVYVLGMFTLKHLALNNMDFMGIYTVSAQMLAISFVVVYLWLVRNMFAKTREIRAQERIFNPEAFHREVDQKNSTQREYKSNIRLLGIPLFHFQFGYLENDDKPAVGWLAGGSKAYGMIFAWGGVAIAPISVGIIALGIVPIGVVGIGIIGLGTVAIGIVGFGASAIAYKAYGSMSALGWESAWSGAFSVAKDAAIAPIAYATEINNEQAAELINLNFLGQSYPWVLAFMAILVIVPAVWHSRKVRQRMK